MGGKVLENKLRGLAATFNLKVERVNRPQNDAYVRFVTKQQALDFVSRFNNYPLRKMFSSIPTYDLSSTKPEVDKIEVRMVDPGYEKKIDRQEAFYARKGANRRQRKEDMKAENLLCDTCKENKSSDSFSTNQK